MIAATIENMTVEQRLFLAYGQIPATRRLAYGRIINAYRFDGLQAALESLRCWEDMVKLNAQNAFWAYDEILCACFRRILSN